MEDAPVTAATGALGPVVAKLRALLRRRRRRGDREYQLRRHTRKDVKLIKSKLKSIHSILWVTWEREDLDVAGKELRMEAWRLADDMNDAIDDFILSMKRSNDGKRFTQAKIQPSPFQDLKRRAVDVSERCRDKWKMDIAQTTTNWSLFSTTKTTFDKRPRVFDTYVRKDVSELVDMEEPRDKLVQHLIGEEESTPQVKMAFIHGAVGMGKTTLARLVYEAIEDKFQARAFVSILSCRNMTEVLASILQQVAVDSTAVLLDGTKAATKNKHLINVISTFLKDKRYLVIIDDIWHSGEWETVKESLPENYLGSRIVSTSRGDAITDKWRDNFDALVYKIDDIGYLGYKSSRMIDMNAYMVGEGFERDHPIVNMCRGMPLAVACMFSALAKERERQEQRRQWLCIETRDLQYRIDEQVTRNGIQNTPGFEPLVESLELGYNHLPHPMLKTCLLYCSIYPEGHFFKRDDLVRRWMAQGFVCKEEVGKDYFEELVNRGFIINNSLHRMVRNYLRCKLREHNFITCSSDIIPSSPVGALCIDTFTLVDYWPESTDAVNTLSVDNWQNIRSLVVFEDAKRVPYKHLRHMRVLDVQCISQVLANQHLMDMCGLLRLRHLLLESPGLVFGWLEIKMPAEIARLQYLETLEVKRIGIRQLPAEIGDLKQLKTLAVSYGNITELPREMGNLQHLETLIICGSNIREQAWEIIWTLKKLKTLDMSENHELSGIPRDIGELQQLKNLNLKMTGITEVPKEIGKLLHLETLNLSSTRITELPHEIGNLQRLHILDLGYVSTITKLPRDIGRLQHLEKLNLSQPNVRKMPREIGGLKKLKYLTAEFGILPFEAGQFPKLEGLPKCIHKAWKNRELLSSLAGEILSFRTRDRFDDGDDGGLVVGTKHMHIPHWIKEHFNNIRTLDIRICTLEERGLKILREMPNLWDLTLRFEAVPRKPIVISSGGFAELLYLTVDSRVPRITFQEGAMPWLRWLQFEFQFYGGPPNADRPMGIKHLVSLKEVIFRCNEWYREDSPCICAIIDVVRKEAWQHTNRIRFTLDVGDLYRVFERPEIEQGFRLPHADLSQGSNEASSSEEGNQSTRSGRSAPIITT